MTFGIDQYNTRQDGLPKKWHINTVVTQAYLEKIELPQESIGYCMNYKGKSIYCLSKKSNDEMPLANGYCLGCWDSGKGGQLPKSTEDNNKMKNKNVCT